AYKKTKESYMTPYKGVVNVLKKLKKKYKLAIISDAPRVNAWSRLLAMKIDKFFDVVVTKSDVKVQKPSSKIFNVALKKLKVKPSEAIMVGDRIERDIKGARALGIKTCFARYGNPKAKKGKSRADWEIESVGELERVVRA
ncbi:MAG: HAD-IA family hydrolase, partial [Candidatus Pacearchaeota archaeon]